MLSPDQIAAYITAIASAGAYSYERWVNRRKTLKSEEDQGVIAEALVFKSRGDMLLKLCEEYKHNFEVEHASHQKTRDFHHDQAKLAQEKLARCNEICIELQARTDITRLEKLITAQTVALTEQTNGIRELLKHAIANSKQV